MAPHIIVPALTVIPETLIIDFEKGEARTNSWTRTVVDCSDAKYNCIVVEGIFGASFPKKCADSLGVAAYDSPAGRMRIVAPQVHFGLPFGSYISEKYPNSLLLYGNAGLSEIRTVRASPFQPNFDHNSFVVSYRIISRGRAGIFLCGKP